MISKLKKDLEPTIYALLRENYLQNPYLYIDAITEGFATENIETWVIKAEEAIYGVLYQYYNSLQICFFANDIKKQADIIAEFIKQKNYEMVSGRADIITCIAQKLPMYISSFGEILSKSPQIENRSYDIKAEIATAEECNEIAQLICSDQNIGGHYTVENLEKQLRDRMHRWDCINMIIRMEGKIVSHMATYANCDEFAVLGGLVTERTHRGKGYGRQIISELTQKVTRDGKQPILYCYDKNTIRWYNSMNWKTVMHCGKLEKRR